MNNLLTNMYVDNKGAGSAGNDNELIDISSDDTDNEEDNIDTPGKKNKKHTNILKPGDSKLISNI